MPIGQPTMTWGAGALRDLEAPAGSVRVVDRLEMVGHAWGCSCVGAFTVGGTAGDTGARGRKKLSAFCFVFSVASSVFFFFLLAAHWALPLCCL